jgi:hypothetical protein
MHSRSSICGLLSISALLLSSLHAQTHEVDAPEKVIRAIGVYEWTGDLANPTAARLIPVSLFIDGHFEDAGVYLAQPVPFALQTGDVYSIERAGQSIGSLDLDFARNIVTRRSATDDNPLGAWFGYGRFITPAEEARANSLHAAANPPVIAADSDSNDAPPTLRRHDPTDKTTHRKTGKQPGYVTPPNTSLNDDPDRPTLHRGIPADTGPTPQLTSLPPNLHQAVAVSDAANRAPHIFTREWATSTGRTQTLRDLEALARPRLSTYIALNKLTPAAATKPNPPGSGPSFASTPKKPAPATHPAHSARKKTASPPLPPIALTNEQLSAYTLSFGGLPTFIYTVEAPITDGGPVYLTLVVQAVQAAQRLPSGELQVALSSVTDATHLDRTPWLRPIDVVDPDASHSASLLFELRAQSSRQFALYRLITAEAEQTFITGLIE